MLLALATSALLAAAAPELPARAVGVLVLPGAHPWGTFYEPGFDWSWAGTEERTVHRFLVGPDANSELAPYFSPGGEAANPFALNVELPGGRAKYTVDMAPGALERGARRAGVDVPVALVEVEVNDGRGARGRHFVITGARVLDGRLDQRLRAARGAFDALVEQHENALARALRSAEQQLRAKTPRERVLGDVPGDELVVYRPYWNAATKTVDVYFGYRKVAGLRVKTEPRDQGFTKRAPPPPVVVARYGVMMGARYRLGGGIDELTVFAPRALEGRRVPWEDERGRVVDGQKRQHRLDARVDEPGETCPASSCGPRPGMPAKRCADGSRGGFTGRCVKKGDDCGWEIKRCK
ncbi:MAG: hypothetical protein A2138_22005 [Deltaproteobacteria bacterium RBG_16_71_12]|nr:MAG: hypothetical protein A2138_22005 [Deltaproteobacteria bacterium RBG_16_71_12]